MLGGSESHCLLGQLRRIFEISDSDAGLKVEKSGGKVCGEGQCGDTMRHWRVEKKERDVVWKFYE